jgi:hypothetical protein
MLNKRTLKRVMRNRKEVIRRDQLTKNVDRAMFISTLV